MSALLAIALVAQAPVTSPAPATPVETRAASLVAFFAGSGDYQADFDERFRAAVPEAQIVATSAQLRQQFGKPLAIERVTAQGPLGADVVIGFERGTVAVTLTVDPAPPYRITGLRITGTQMRGDTLASVAADVRALPGGAGIGVWQLETGKPPRALLAVNADTPAPVGSAFKLWVLAEATRQVQAGTRKWSDVVALGPRALPSGQMQRWPAGAPVTLQTLATMMIAISDNTATDTLMTALGRACVEAMVATAGTAAPARTLPLLTTREATAIKADPALAAAWARADLPERRRLLRANAARLASATLDPALFDGTPRSPESVEWFASPADMARTLDWLRRHGDAPTQAILAINPGIAPAAARQFGYVGYKGGSEPGVMAMNLLLNTRDGRWFAVTGNWHRADAGVDEARFAALMTRAAGLVER